MSTFGEDVADSRPSEVGALDTGESSIDVMLDGIDALAASTQYVKTWHIAPLPEDELSEMVLTFLGAPSGTIETV